MAPTFQSSTRKHPTHEDLAQKQEKEKKEEGERKRRVTESTKQANDKYDGRARFNSENLELKKAGLQIPLRGIGPVSEDDAKNETTPLKKRHNPNSRREETPRVITEPKKEAQDNNLGNLNAANDDF